MTLSLPFTVCKYLHSNLTHLVTTADNKFDIVDANVILELRDFKN
jgi:hypothetical protein